MTHTRRKNALYSRVVALTAVRPEKAFIINILLVAGILFTLIAHAMLINHLNTVNFKLEDLSAERSRLAERNNELEQRIAEGQALGTIEERALDMGMIAVAEYRFLSSVDTVVAQR